jgi:hypothetical protein
MKFEFILLILVLFLFVINGEENFYFRRLSVENGLPQNTVNRIFQDMQGLIRFGTKDNPNRPDFLRRKIKGILCLILNDFIQPVRLKREAGQKYFGLSPKDWGKMS